MLNPSKPVLSRSYPSADDLARAIARAVHANVRIVWRGHSRKPDHAPCWGVSSATEPGKVYTVWHDLARGQLRCTCRGTQFGRYCLHRALIAHKLLQRPQVEPTPLAAAPAYAARQDGSVLADSDKAAATSSGGDAGDEDVYTVRLTPAGAAALRRWELKQVPKPLDNTRRVSMWR